MSSRSRKAPGAKRSGPKRSGRKLPKGGLTSSGTPEDWLDLDEAKAKFAQPVDTPTKVEPETPTFTQAGTPWPRTSGQEYALATSAPDDGPPEDSTWPRIPREAEDVVERTGSNLLRFPDVEGAARRGVSGGQRMAAANSAYQGEIPGGPSPGGGGPGGTCALCGEEFDGMGHNPQPLAQPPARCCDRCNAEKVVPARIGRIAADPDWDPRLGRSVPAPSDEEAGTFISSGGRHAKDLDRILREARGRGVGSTPSAPVVRTASDVAELRTWLVTQWQESGAFAQTAARLWSSEATTRVRPEALDPDPARATRKFYESERTMLQRADLYWVHPDMVELLDTVRPSVPVDVKPEDLVWPSDALLVVFGRSLSGIDADPETGRPVTVDAIVVGRTRLPAPGGAVHYCASVTSYRRLRFEDGLAPHELALAAQTGAYAAAQPIGVSRMKDGQETIAVGGDVWVPLGRSDWPLGEDLGLQPPWIVDSAWPSFLEDRQTLAALFTLLDDRKTLFTQTDHAPISRPVRRRAERAGVESTPNSVVVVTLRQPKRVHPPHPDGPVKIEYSHRWYSKAHVGWRWCGPGKSERRLVPVRGSIKGPPDAPFVAKTRVNAWVR